MNIFEIHDKIDELLMTHTPYELAKELAVLKEEHENLLWEYRQALRELEELRGDNPWQK